MAIGGKGKKNKPQRGGEKQFTSITELQKETANLNVYPINEFRSKHESSDDEEEEIEKKLANPAAAFIDISNPNRVGGKQTMKLKDLNIEDDEQEKPELNRREREALQKEQAKAHYMKMTAEGKTDQARSDLARLALIRKQREEAKLKREEASNAANAKKDASLNAGKSIISKSLGKK